RDRLEVESGPSLMRFANVQHLATWITGQLDSRQPASDHSVLALADALHYTPAVCGTPAEAAMEMIRDLEAMDRGRYAGPVGWVDARGNGEWGSALRGAAGAGSPARPVAGAGVGGGGGGVGGGGGGGGGCWGGGGSGGVPDPRPSLPRRRPSSPSCSSRWRPEAHPGAAPPAASAAAVAAARSLWRSAVPASRLVRTCTTRIPWPRSAPARSQARSTVTAGRPAAAARLPGAAGPRGSPPWGVQTPRAKAPPYSACSSSEKIPPPSLFATTTARSGRGSPGPANRPGASCRNARSPSRAAAGPPPARWCASAAPAAVEISPSIPLAPRLASTRSPARRAIC